MFRINRGFRFCVGLAVIVNAVALCGTIQAADSVSSEDIFRDQSPELDSEKAHVPFDELKPVIEIEHDDAVADPLPDRVVRAIDRTVTLRGEERYTEALIELEKAQRIAAGDRRIVRALALTAWLSGDYKRARYHVEQSLKQGEDDTTCHYILGRLAASRFENETAILEYRKTLACSGDVDGSMFARAAEGELGALLLAEGYIQAAIDLYTAITARSTVYIPELEEHKQLYHQLVRHQKHEYEQLAWAHAKLGQYARAVEYLDSLKDDLDIQPHELIDHAKLYARAGDMDKAIRHARDALSMQPEAVEVLMAIYAHQNRPDAIVEAFESAIEGGDASPKVTSAYARALIESDRKDEAVRLMESQLESPSAKLETIGTAVEVFLAAGAWNPAIEAMIEAVRNRTDAAAEVTNWIRSHAEINENSDLAHLATGNHLAKASDFAESYVLGQVALAFDERDAGQTWMEHSLEERPAFVAARVALARIFLDRWQWQEAIDIAAPKKYQFDRDTRLEAIAGQAYRGLDDPESAIKHFESAIRLHRGNIDAMLELAELYDEANRTVASRRQLEKILRIDAFNDEARSRLCLNHINNGDRRAAAEQIQKMRVHRAAPTVVARCIAALEFNASNPDYDRFRKTLQNAIDASKPDVDSLQLIGLSYMQQMNWPDAIAALESARQMEPNNIELTSMLMECRTRNLEFEDALVLQEELLKRHPHRAVWKNNLLELLLTVQRYEAAMVYGRQLIEDSDSNPAYVRQIRTKIVAIHRALGNDSAALKELELMRLRASDDPGVLLYLINICQGIGKHDRAMELIKRWQTDIPGGFARGDLNVIWRDLPSYQRGEVMELLLEAIESDPQNDRLHTTMIAFLRETNQFDEAIALAKNSAVDGAFKELYLNELQLTYDVSGQPDEAIDVIEGMMAVSDEEMADNIEIHGFLRQAVVQVLINHGRAAEAVDRLNRWLKQARNAGSIESEYLYLSLLSFAYQESGDLDGAREALEKYFKLDPTNVGLHNDLGYTLADTGLELDRAENMIRLAVGDSPRNSAYLDSLGWVHYKKGEFAEAKRWLAMARRGFDGEDPVICEHMGDTCWQLGDRDDAVKWWKEGLEMAEKALARPPVSGPTRRAVQNAKQRLESVENGTEPNVATVVKRSFSDE